MSIGIGAKIKEYRLKNNMTQLQLAEKLNVTPQAVSKWENSIACPDIYSLPLIARLFGITIDELLCEKTK